MQIVSSLHTSQIKLKIKLDTESRFRLQSELLIQSASTEENKEQCNQRVQISDRDSSLYFLSQRFYTLLHMDECWKLFGDIERPASAKFSLQWWHGFCWHSRRNSISDWVRQTNIRACVQWKRKESNLYALEKVHYVRCLLTINFVSYAPNAENLLLKLKNVFLHVKVKSFKL